MTDSVPGDPLAAEEPRDVSASDAPASGTLAVPDGVAAPTPPAAPPTRTQAERVIRGILLSLVVIPLGAFFWVVLWKFGFIASIVSFAVAWAAVALYRIGSGNRVTRSAFWGLLGVIIAALIVSFLAGIGSDIATVLKLTPTQAMTSDAFWSTFWLNVFGNPRMWSAYMPQLLLSLAFAALGCFGTIRRLARESRG